MEMLCNKIEMRRCFTSVFKKKEKLLCLAECGTHPVAICVLLLEAGKNSFSMIHRGILY